MDGQDRAMEMLLENRQGEHRTNNISEGSYDLLFGLHSVFGAWQITCQYGLDSWIKTMKIHQVKMVLVQSRVIGRTIVSRKDLLSFHKLIPKPVKGPLQGTTPKAKPFESHITIRNV